MWRESLDQHSNIFRRRFIFALGLSPLPLLFCPSTQIRTIQLLNFFRKKSAPGSASATVTYDIPIASAVGELELNFGRGIPEIDVILMRHGLYGKFHDYVDGLKQSGRLLGVEYSYPQNSLSRSRFYFRSETDRAEFEGHPVLAACEAAFAGESINVVAAQGAAIYRL